MTHKNRMYLLAAMAGAVASVCLTLLIYATFFQDILEQFQVLTPEVVALITQENPILAAIALANLAHGFLIATVIRWGKFYTPLRGAGAAAVVAFLTELYFCFTQYAMFKTMTATSAILDALMWTLINALVGALVAWISARGTQDAKESEPPQDPKS